ncbi:MAG: hypothetical protein PVJ02_18935, partial [Gemmatimonadota bacterium]
MRRLRSLVGRALGAVLWVAAVAVGVPADASAQIRVSDLVVTMGGSVEGYSGNFSSVIVPLVDSARSVVATVGELGVRGGVSLVNNRDRSLGISFDGGLRQTAAMGFRRQDYAPREWVGSASGRFRQRLSTWGSLQVRAALQGRSVRDRPPTPLFLQPAYSTTEGSVGLVTRSFDGVSIDAQADLERTDYRGPELLPHLDLLDLLDRHAKGLEVGVRWGGPSTVRFYGGVRWTEYTHQSSYDPSDPYRRDRTARVGMEWTYAGNIFAQVGLEGAVNRSNSNRPEYDALSFRAILTAPLPADFSLNLYAVLTGKSYLTDTQAARLVPGEEADNASIAYLQLGHPLAENL